MDALSRLREQHKRLAARVVSARANTPTHFTAQRTGHAAHSEIKGYPTQICDDLQDLDIDSPTFGQWLYSAGSSGLGVDPLG